jgi:hypothetical protein
MESVELVNRNEVLLLLEELKRSIAGNRRAYLVDGRQIEAAACSLQAVSIDSAINLVKTVKRRG